MGIGLVSSQILTSNSGTTIASSTKNCMKDDKDNKDNSLLYIGLGIVGAGALFLLGRGIAKHHAKKTIASLRQELTQGQDRLSYLESCFFSKSRLESVSKLESKWLDLHKVTKKCSDDIFSFIRKHGENPSEGSLKAELAALRKAYKSAANRSSWAAKNYAYEQYDIPQMYNDFKSSFIPRKGEIEKEIARLQKRYKLA